MVKVARWSLLALLAACHHTAPGRAPDGGRDAPSDVGAQDAPAPSFELVGAWPSLAPAGSTVTLEGTFENGSVVHLPGGGSASINVLGPHRATMVVPAGTTLGELSLNAGGTMTGRVAFHAVTYQLGLQPFESYEQTGTAQEPNLLPTHLTEAGSVTLGSNVYLFGGRDTNGLTAAVERAPLNPDGSLGAFTVASDISLTTPRSGFACVVIDNYVYVIGGFGTMDGLSSTVERAPIQPDGTLGTFALVPDASLSEGRNQPMAAVVGDYLYVMGGYGEAPMDAMDAAMPPAPLDTVERAQIAPDGTLGPFAPVTGVTLASGRADGASVVIGNTLYVFGGGGGNISVDAASINPDGTISTFAMLQNVTMAGDRYGFSTLILGDGLYTFGGLSIGTSNAAAIERAPINADGTIGSFVNSGQYLAQNAGGGALAVSGNYVYVVGGASGDGTIGSDSVQRVSMDGDGGLGAPSAVSGTTLATPTYDQGIVTSGSSVYLIGGATSPGTYTSAVQSATVTDGILGSFSTASAALAMARAGFATAVIGSYAYVIGGNTSAGAVGTLERALIAPDGTLGTFAAYPDASLVTPRAHASAVVVAGYGSTRYLLVIGGIGADGTILGTVEWAPINADGSLGAFGIDADATLQTPRYGAAVAVHHETTDNHYVVYVIGGIGASGYLADVERGTVALGGSVPANFGGFGQVTGITLGTPRAAHTVAIVGSTLYVIGGVGGSGALSGIEVSQFTGDEIHPLSTFAPLATGSLATPRGYSSSVVIANQLYTIGGQGSAGALDSIEAAPLQ